jgi:glycosyltransferase involved in cell wall biosynthesis
MKNVSKRVALCVYPFAGETVHSQLGKFIHILESITQKLYLIAGVFPEADTYSDKVDIRDIRLRIHAKESIKPGWLSMILWGYKYIIIQIKMTYQLFKVRKDIDLVILHYGVHYPLTILIAKMMRKKIIKLFFCPTREDTVYKKPSPMYYINNFLDWIIISLSDLLVVGTEGSIERFHMMDYKDKLTCSLNHWFIDSIFQIHKTWSQRKYLLGYIGRFRKDKGVIELAKAIPLILAENKGARCLMVGDGVLMADFKKILEQNDCISAVDFTGYVDYNKIPNLLNDMQFHVLASIAEVSGAVNMEAMACGTIAIANAAGGIPDIITDKVNGFLMPDNNPQTIANTVHEAINFSEPDKIIKNARQYVDDTFTQEVAVTRWQEILNSV